MKITWKQRVANLRKALKRAPTLQELLDASQIHQMTPEETQAQRESFARGMQPCEHGIADFEDCEQCRAKVRK